MTVVTAPTPATQQTRLTGGLGRAVPLLVPVGVAGLLAELGFFEPLVGLWLCRLAQAAPVLAFAAAYLVPLRSAPDRFAYGKRHWLELALIVAAAGALVAGPASALTVLRAGVIYLTMMEAALVARGLVETLVESVALGRSRWGPIGLMAATFLALIMAGGLLLALPSAMLGDHRNMPWTHLLNSLFTATSAASLTGLAVYKPATEFTLFGQIVILALIQLGGLAILIFGTLLGVAIVERLAPQEALLGRLGLGQRDAGQLRRIVLWIVGGTLAIEAIGAVLLYPASADGVSTLDRWFPAAFHSVSALCNAGMTVRPDSLIALSGQWRMYGVILPLIVLGGLGVPVLHEIIARLLGRLRGLLLSLRLPFPRPSPLAPDPCRSPWSLHTRLVVAATLVLIVAGAAALWLIETPTQMGGFWYVGHSHLLGGYSAGGVSPQWMRSHEGPRRLLDAVFQAISARSAGFHTVPVESGAMSPASLAVLGALMFIGGSPASTAGGIKTVVLAVVVLAAWSALRRRDHVMAAGRVLPASLVRRALALVLVAVAWTGGVMIFLAHTQRADFLAVAFETVSAASTTGLSLGLTPQLTIGGKVAIILTMLAGRLGPLMLAVLMAGGTSAQPVPTLPQPAESVILA